jgi:diguanylate cyclase (GGDEF)-like protein
MGRPAVAFSQPSGAKSTAPIAADFMHLDTPTVSFITVLVTCLETGILVALWRIHRGMRGLSFWAAGAMAISIGVLGIYLRSGMLPSASLVVANFFVLAGFILTWWGIEAFFGRPLPYRLGAVIFVMAAIGVIYFTAESNSRLRIVTLLGSFVLLSVLRVHSMLRDLRPSTRFSQILSGMTLGTQSLFYLALALAVWSLPAVERPLAQLPILGWIFLIPMLLSITVVFAAILLVNQTIAARLQEAARRDALTEALTRRALDEAAEIEVARSNRHHTPLSLLMIDIDHFKLVNDQYGHPAGDMVLRRFAVATQHCLRREDLFGRVGGEEFCTLLPNTPAAGAALLAERIRKAVADLAIEVDGHHLSLKVSIGVATLGEHGKAWQDLVRQADAALYAAKRAGRNRVVIADAIPLPAAAAD